MLNNWKKITQDNKVKLIVFICGTVLIPVVVYFGKGLFESPATPNTITPKSITQTTSGDSSPVVSDTNGDVTININGSGSGKQP